jgi:C1A family cysteine protease
MTFLYQSNMEKSLIWTQVDHFKGYEFDSLFIKRNIPIDVDSLIKKRNVVLDDSIKIDSNIKLPSEYSLKDFAPEVGNQGQLGSCVSWASSYGGMSMVKRIESGNKTLTPFSPLNLYIRLKLKNGESPCSSNSDIQQSLELLKNNGCEQYDKFDNICSANPPPINKIYNNKLFDYSYINVTKENIKKAIYTNCPVVFGIACHPKGSDWENLQLDQGVWNGYFSGNVDGGHAMCIVGYDDNKAGGAFEVLNSWGKDFGKSGYFWIKYDDFICDADHVSACFALIPNISKNIELLK